MPILRILQYPDDRLHTVAAPVLQINNNTRTLIKDMAETMYAAPGIGLAATQVDVHQRIIVIDVSERMISCWFLLTLRLPLVTVCRIMRKAVYRCLMSMERYHVLNQ